LIWIALGVVLIGAVHDFSTLTASLRHSAKSVAEITRDQLGLSAGRAMMAFYLDRTRLRHRRIHRYNCRNFCRRRRSTGRRDELQSRRSVALASVLYLGLSIVLGLVEKFIKPPLWLSTIIFVPATFALSYMGTQYSHVLIYSHQTWAVIILLYV
jgi:carbon starvation protein